MEKIEKECQLFVYKKCPINKNFFVFDPILTKLCEIVVLMSEYLLNHLVTLFANELTFYLIKTKLVHQLQAYFY